MNLVDNGAAVRNATTSVAQKELERFGKLYTGKDGRSYLSVGGTGIGIRLDFLKPFSGTVRSFREAERVAWWRVEVEGIDRAVFLSNNWVAVHGSLMEGEPVEGLLGLDASKDEEVYYVWLIQRVPKEAESIA